MSVPYMSAIAVAMNRRRALSEALEPQRLTREPKLGRIYTVLDIVQAVYGVVLHTWIGLF